MLSYDPVANLRHYPIAMRRFGLTPQSEPLYRIVFAPSRRYLVVGEWPDGSDCAHWVVKHKNVGNVWIMERWLPAEQYAKCTREQWDATMLVLGPWPTQGEYELCHVFDTAQPCDANIETLVTWIEAGRNIRFEETRAFHHKQADAELNATRNQAEDLIRNRLPAYGCRPFVGGRVHRGSKTYQPLKTAEELGLPTQSGFSTKPNPPQVAA
jgi:hypothetical protein